MKLQMSIVPAGFGSNEVKQERIQTVTETSSVLVYDIGGSHAIAGIVERNQLSISCQQFRALDSSGTSECVLDTLLSLGASVFSHAKQNGSTLDAIAIAAPGPFDYANGISLLRHKYSSLYGRNLRLDFARRFEIPEEHVLFLNDADAFLLGECHAGAAKQLNKCVGITLGTGIGSAFAIDGKIINVGGGVPEGGEIYCLPWKDRTVEDFVSSRGIQDRYEWITGQRFSVREICSAAKIDQSAAQVMRDFGSVLGEVLREICMPFHPEAIILGGAISKSGHLFLPSANQALGSGQDLLRLAQLFDDAPLIGAAVHSRQSISKTPAEETTQGCTEVGTA